MSAELTYPVINFATKRNMLLEPSEQYEAGPYTRTPNIFFDELLAEIDNLAEMKITLAIIRKTHGWRKEHDVICFDQLQELSGLSRSMVSKGIDCGLARGSIVRTRSGHGFSYSLDLINYKRGFTISNRGSHAPIKERVQTVNSCDKSSDCEPSAVQTVNSLTVQTVNTQKKSINKHIKEINTVVGKTTTQLTSELPTPANIAAPSPAKKPAIKKSTEKPVNHNSKHPAIVIYREVFRRSPNFANMQQIVDTVGEDAEQLAEWRKALLYWAGNEKWNQLNVAGQLRMFNEKGYIYHEREQREGRSYLGGNGGFANQQQQQEQRRYGGYRNKSDLLGTTGRLTIAELSEI